MAIRTERIGFLKKTTDVPLGLALLDKERFVQLIKIVRRAFVSRIIDVTKTSPSLEIGE